MRQDIRDSRGTMVGYLDDRGSEILYYGITKGLIGRFVKSPARWWWIGKNSFGPMCDIGCSEVFKAENARY